MKDLQKVENIEINIDSSMDNAELNEVPEVLSLMSTYIVEIHKTEMGQHNLLQRLIKLALNNPNCKSGYNFGMESVKAFIYTSSEWIQKYLMNNHELCEIVAHVNDNEDIIVDGDSMDIEDQMNARVLLPPDKLPEPLDLERNPQLIK